jgi:hypothetical protein
MLAHVGYLTADAIGQLAYRQLSLGETLEDAQSLGVGQGSGHYRRALPRNFQFACVEHAAILQAVAQARK